MPRLPLGPALEDAPWLFVEVEEEVKESEKEVSSVFFSLPLSSSPHLPLSLFSVSLSLSLSL